VPHFTLCRYDAQVRGSAQGVRVDRAITMDEFTVTRVSLMKSVLRADGSQHGMVAEFGLSA
jgi:2'-5' RNA ligase